MFTKICTGIQVLIISYFLFLTVSTALPLFAREVKKDVLSPIINQADKEAVRIEIYRINIGDKTVWCRLYDVGGTLIEDKRVYAFDGGYKNIPVVLLADEIEYLDGQDPSEQWNVETIKLWMNDRQIQDEDGKVSQEDLYYYKDDVTKDDLLISAEK